MSHSKGCLKNTLRQGGRFFERSLERDNTMQKMLKTDFPLFHFTQVLRIISIFADKS